MGKTTKTINFSHIVLKHDLLRGHLRWTIAGVANEAEYSRAWVYKQFGSSKSEILLDSLKIALDHQLVVSPEKEKIIAKKGPLKVFKETRASISKYPEATMFVFKFYFSDCIYGKTIRDYEEKYSKGLRDRYDLKTPFQENFVRSLIHGIVVGPFLDEKSYLQLAKIATDPRLHQFLLDLED